MDTPRARFAPLLVAAVRRVAPLLVAPPAVRLPGPSPRRQLDEAAEREAKWAEYRALRGWC